MSRELETEPVIEVSPKRKLVMSLEFIGVCVGMIGIIITAWITVKDDLRSAHQANVLQDKRLELLETRADLQREVLYEVRSDLKANKEQTSLVIEMLKQQNRSREALRQ